MYNLANITNAKKNYKTLSHKILKYSYLAEDIVVIPFSNFQFPIMHSVFPQVLLL